MEIKNTYFVMDRYKAILKVYLLVNGDYITEDRESGAYGLAMKTRYRKITEKEFLEMKLRWE